MKKLLNTLYITNPESYLMLDNENVVVLVNDKTLGKIPLRNLESIITFGYKGVSSGLAKGCIDNEIDLCLMSSTGKFIGRFSGKINGNVFLRREQYRIADDARSIEYARNFIIGKVYNSIQVIKKYRKDYVNRININFLDKKIENLKNYLDIIKDCKDKDILRSLEGHCAEEYFSCINEFILQQKDDFHFTNRNKRPPLDNLNALLSFAYTFLGMMCEAGLNAVGLDSYVGFMHTDRPGRASLALDLIEELRSIYADRFCITLINKKIITKDDFDTFADGAVHLNDKGKKIFLEKWQTRKTEEINHPFLDEKIEWGLVPYAQALLLARAIRGDINEYPPFLYRY